MKASLKKAFRFSCAYSRGTKTIGRNYVLWLTLDVLSSEAEFLFEERVQKALIDKIHNRDLSQSVDFLNQAAITDEHLVEAFYRILRAEMPEYPIVSLELERDSSTRTIYAAI